MDLAARFNFCLYTSLNADVYSLFEILPCFLSSLRAATDKIVRQESTGKFEINASPLNVSNVNRNCSTSQIKRKAEANFICVKHMRLRYIVV